MASVLLTPEAQENFRGLPKSIQLRVYGILDRLEAWPAVAGAKPLRGNLAGRYRIRTGDYRVQFYIETTGTDHTVKIEKIGHRDGFYED